MIVFKFSQTSMNKILKFYVFQICAYFSSSFSGSWVFAVCDFWLNKSCKTYLVTILAPVGRNWQLISPHEEVVELHLNNFGFWFSKSFCQFDFVLVTQSIRWRLRFRSNNNCSNNNCSNILSWQLFLCLSYSCSDDSFSNNS